MASGRNDVEFSIGADNTQLAADVLEAAQIMSNFVNDVSTGLDSLEESAQAVGGAMEDLTEAIGLGGTRAQELAAGFGRLLGVAGQAANLAMQFYTSILDSVKAQTGLNHATERAIELEKERLELSKDRAADVESIERAKELLAVELDLIGAMEERKDKLGQITFDPQLKGPFNPRGERPLNQEELDERKQLTEDMAQKQEVINGLREDIVKFELDAEKEKTKEQEKRIKEQEKADKELAKERKKELERVGAVLDKNKKESDKQLKTFRAEREKQDNEAERENEKRQREIDRIEGPGRVLSQTQLDSMRESLDKMQKRAVAPDKQLGGFDKGLDAIGDRIADAASQGRDFAEMERLAQEQVELQNKIATESKRTADALTTLKQGMTP